MSRRLSNFCVGFLLIGSLILNSSKVYAQDEEETSDESPRPGLNELPDASESAVKRRAMDYAAVGPDGAVLPENVLRYTIPMRIKTGTKSYDDKGKARDYGIEASGTGVGLILEYGLTPSVSLQLGIPVVLRNEIKFNQAKFRAEANKEAARSIGEGLAATVAETPPLAALLPDCAKGAEACTAWILNDGAAPTDLPIAGVTVPAGTPIIKAFEPTIDSNIASRQALYENGETGLGDIEIGALYNFLKTDKMLSSIGLGIRLPTGSFQNVKPAHRPTGRGTTDLGVRVNFDYIITPYLLFGYENLAEHQLVKGKKKIGDESKDFERVGVRNHGFFKLAYAAGHASEALKAFGFALQYVYDYDAETRTNKVTDQLRAQKDSYAISTYVSGLDYGIPLEAEISKTTLLSARNQPIGTDTLYFHVRSFLKF